MTAAPVTPTTPSMEGTRTDWVAVVRDLGPTFAARAAAHDANDSFVADNYAELKQRKAFSAWPEESTQSEAPVLMSTVSSAAMRRSSDSTG